METCTNCSNELPKDRKWFCYECWKPQTTTIKVIEEDEEDEGDDYCPFCNGSGQGMYDGSSCCHC